MANQFISIKEIARATLPRLIENLVMPNLYHKDYSGDYATGKGAQIQVKKPVKLTASEFDASTGTTAQDLTQDSVTVELDKIATVDASISAIEGAVNVGSLTETFIDPAAVALAEKINGDGLALYKDIPYYTGTSGTTPDGLDDFANAEKVLNRNKAPIMPRYGVWNPDADAAFKQIPAIVNAEKSGTTDAQGQQLRGYVEKIDTDLVGGYLSTVEITARRVETVSNAAYAAQIPELYAGERWGI